MFVFLYSEKPKIFSSGLKLPQSCEDKIGKSCEANHLQASLNAITIR